jgi:hypothetical protein
MPPRKSSTRFRSSQGSHLGPAGDRELRLLIREMLRESLRDPKFSGSDPNVESMTMEFARLVDAVAAKMGLEKQPVITSALRGPERQSKAMYDIWRGHGPEYLISLYGEICKSCDNPGAGEAARELVDLWTRSFPGAKTGSEKASGAVKKDIFSRAISKASRTIGEFTGKLPPSEMPPDVAKEAASIVARRPISAHQRGAALDYGTNSNNKTDIEQILIHIRNNGYADFETIDETSGPGPHIHVTVKSVNDKGREFLQREMQSERRKILNRN